MPRGKRRVSSDLDGNPAVDRAKILNLPFHSPGWRYYLDRPAEIPGGKDAHKLEQMRLKLSTLHEFLQMDVNHKLMLSREGIATIKETLEHFQKSEGNSRAIAKLLLRDIKERKLFEGD